MVRSQDETESFSAERFSDLSSPTIMFGNILSKKVLVANLKVSLVETKASILFDCPLEQRLQEEIRYISYLLLFDKTLFNLPQEIASPTITSIQRLASSLITQASEEGPEIWEKKKISINTPNKWNFQNEIPVSEKDFTMEASVYKKADRLFCETNFSKTELIELKSYLMLEALLVYFIQKQDYATSVYHLLPSLLAQCSFYEGEKPTLTQLGQAVNFGLTKSSNLREQHGID